MILGLVMKPTLLMVVVQTVFSLVNICYKLAANDGMNLSILVGYRFMFGAAFIVPVALFAERKKRPKLTRKIIFYAFLCGLFGGSLGQNLYVEGLVLTSATFASAITNLIPAITFVVALSLRLERLGWNTAAGKAKVFGTVVGVGGAMIISTRGRSWTLGTHALIFSKQLQPIIIPPACLTINTVAVDIFSERPCRSLVVCVIHSGSLLRYGYDEEAKAAEVYPCPYSFTAMMAVAATLQGMAFALTVDSNWNQWKLGWDIRLFTVAFSGILASGLMFSVVAWCVRARGPLFVSIFQPLMLVLVGLMGSLFLEENLHLGMVIGALFIVTGLYIVLWGKGKEIRIATPNNDNQERTTDTRPPPPLPTRVNNNASRSEAEAEVEEETHIDIPPPPPPPPPPQNSNRRGSSAEEEIEAELEVEEETHIDIPAPPLPLPPPPPWPLQKGSSRSNKEEEAYQDKLPPSKSGGRVEAEVESRIELPLPASKNSSHSSSSSAKAEVDSQNSSSDSSSDSRVDSPRRKDLTQKQNKDNQSSKASVEEAEAVMEVQSGGSRNMKEVATEAEVDVGTRRSSCGSRKEVEVEVVKRVKEKKD